MQNETLGLLPCFMIVCCGFTFYFLGFLKSMLISSALELNLQSFSSSGLDMVQNPKLLGCILRMKH
jgi:hypothetical protein